MLWKMKQSFLFANLIFILYLFTSCGSSKTIAGDATSYVTPIICAEEYSQKYNMQLDFMKHHFSGLLIVRKLPDNEIRILASTYFGLSLFWFFTSGKWISRQQLHRAHEEKENAAITGNRLQESIFKWKEYPHQKEKQYLWKKSHRQGIRKNSILSIGVQLRTSRTDKNQTSLVTTKDTVGQIKRKPKLIWLNFFPISIKSRTLSISMRQTG